MDSHTGGAPDMSKKVAMDHTIIYEHPGVPEDRVTSVKFSQKVPEKLRRRKFIASKWKEPMINGDMYISVENLNLPAKYDSDGYQYMKRSMTHPSALLGAV